MSTQLDFGDKSPLQLVTSACQFLGELGSPTTPPLADLSQAVEAALATPLGFPAVRTALVGGDRIALPLMPGLWGSAGLVVAVVRSLVAGGATPANIHVIRLTTDESSETVASELKGAGLGEVLVESFDPTNEQQCALLAVAKDDSPIYFEQHLAQADFVLPIVRIDPPGLFAGLTLEWAVFPTFSNHETQKRFRNASILPEAKQKKLQKAAEEAWWLLGGQCVLAVVLGPDGIVKLAAGKVAEVTKHLAPEVQAIAAPTASQKATAVVAAISGSKRQTWLNLARALAAATRVTAEGGTIAVVTHLNAPPGKAVQHLIRGNATLEEAEKLVPQGLVDAQIAVTIMRATAKFRVGLHSQLSSLVVEDLGMVPLASPQDLEKFLPANETCWVLHHAQQVVPRLATASGKSS